MRMYLIKCPNPECGEFMRGVVHGSAGYQIACDHCGLWGPSKPTEEEALQVTSKIRWATPLIEAAEDLLEAAQLAVMAFDDGELWETKQAEMSYQKLGAAIAKAVNQDKK